MIEKNEALQMLEKLEQEVLKLEKQIESQMDKEKLKVTRQVEIDYYHLERKMDLLEEKVNKSVSYTMLQSFA